MKKSDKWIKGFIPMVLMSFSTGSVYCWTLFREDIRTLHPVFTNDILTWCFSLALFCLGMSAAFGGGLVERNVKKASLYTFIFFTLGWLLTGIGVHIGGTAGVVLALIGFGPVQGVGLGLGYLTPVKTMMMWFDGKKGFAAGLAIAAFGLAGIIGNPIIGVLLNAFQGRPYIVFYILTTLYGVSCFVAFILIDRPPLKAEDAAARTLPIREVIFNQKFIFLWLVLFINIAGGLALMSHEQQIYVLLGMDFQTQRALIVAFCSINAGSNLVGRLICASSQDRTPKKHLPYYVMTIASIVVLVLAFFLQSPAVGMGTGIAVGVAVAIGTIFVIQFFFGCGFACLPGILDQNYGMKQLATIQGVILTAWAIAALVGPQIASRILYLGGNPVDGADGIYSTGSLSTLTTLYIILAGLFVVQFIFFLLFVRACKKSPPEHLAQA
ncbi:MAG: MFS transporter [Defluviitaleaceae bacterium]|nr:MFS transporter [Defluviitaleaceae bacterium]